MRQIALAATALALGLLAPGCGGSGNEVWLTGKLLKGGAPYAPPEGQKVTVTFVALEVEGPDGKPSNDFRPFQATVDPSTAAFHVAGVEGRGIPPGKYRVAVTQRMTREAFEALKDKPRGADREADLLKGAFGEANSPILREVRGSTELVIDLDRPSEGPGAG